MTISELSKNMQQKLAPRFGDSETQWMVREVMEQVFARSRTDLIVDGDKPAAPVRVELVDKIVTRLLANEPLQYILGYETFMGLKFKVTPAVLIPRPETEELVELIVSRFGERKDLRVLDLGTGSGCIALSLSRYLPFSEVTGVDISDDALAVARDNAASLGVRSATFVKADMLDLQLPGKFDIVVSNPPYVMESERASMQPNVLDYEPQRALFVPDNDPLKFYKAAALFARTALNPGGALFFELNPLTADALAQWLKEQGWDSVEIVNDARGLKRFMVAKLPQES